jgi:DNA polymerase-3 subunit beta
MQFTIERSALVAAVKAARPAAATRTSLPLLEHLRLVAEPDGELTISANDLEVGIDATTVARVDAPGSATAPAALLWSMLAQCAAPTLNIALDKGRLRIAGGGTKLALPSFDAEDWPLPPGGKELALATCDLVALRLAVARVAFAAARDSSRPVLAGLRLLFDGGTLTIMAADGHRLAIASLGTKGAPPERASIIVPAKRFVALLESLGDGEVAMARVGNVLRLVAPTVRANSRTIEGAYPDLPSMIPDVWQFSASIPRAALRDATKLAGLATAEVAGSRLLELAFDGDALSVRGEDEGQEADVAVPLAAPVADPSILLLNGVFLGEALGALDSETVALRWSPGQVAVLGPGDGAKDQAHGIMPMYRGAKQG